MEPLLGLATELPAQRRRIVELCQVLDGELPPKLPPESRSWGPVPRVACSQRSHWSSTFLAFGKRALPQGRPHAKAQLGEAIQVRCHLVNIAVPFPFDEYSDRAHKANS